MPDPATIPDEIRGTTGDATLLPVRDTPEYAATVCHWLLTAPVWHPAWPQYMIAALRLAGVPGRPPANRQFPDATHEIICVSLNPGYGPYTRDNFGDNVMSSRGAAYLTPVNVAHQLTGTDDEAAQLVRLAAWGLCNGLLEPEASNGAIRIRAAWDSQLKTSLKHIRREAH